MDFEQIITGKPAPISRPPVSARIIRNDASGVWVVPLGGDTRHPVGPCLGADTTGVGSTVLLSFTPDGPWINAAPDAPELYDSPTPPDSPPATYLRFARDLDGHVEGIYLGTVD